MLDYSSLPLFSLQPETREIPLTQGKVAIVDAADYEWLMQWKWHARRSPKKQIWYARRNVHLPGNKWVGFLMHRAILDVDSSLVVDHIDGDGLNNTRINLRPCTNQQNCCNRGMGHANTSGYKGVCWKQQNKKWTAGITFNRKKIYLGIYATAEEAARAYDRAARELQGEFAQLNFKERL